MRNKVSKNKSKEIIQEQLEKFINDLDNDPKCKNTKCCDGKGVCISFEELGNKKKGVK